MLGAGWSFSGMNFLGDRCASINWAGNCYAIAFTVQGALPFG